MSVTAFPWQSLPRVDSIDARWTSRLSLLGRSQVFSDALSKAFEVKCRYEHARASFHPPGFPLSNDDGFVARVTTVPESSPLYVWVPATSCGPLLQRLFDDTTPRGSRLSDQEWGAMAYVALTVLKAGIDAGLPPMHLEANRPPNALIARDFSREPTIESVIVFRGDGMGRNFVRLLVPRATASEIGNHLRPQQYWADAVGRAVIRLPVTRPIADLDASDVRGLAPGDVIFVADSIEKFLGDTYVHTSHHEITSKIVHTDDRFDLLIEWIEETPVATATPEDATTQLTTSTVKVDVKIGDIQISLADLGALAPGTVLTHDTHPGAPVELLVGGQPIATAELVLVGGRVGCRVIQRVR